MLTVFLFSPTFFNKNYGNKVNIKYPLIFRWQSEYFKIFSGMYCKFSQVLMHELLDNISKTFP